MPTASVRVVTLACLVFASACGGGNVASPSPSATPALVTIAGSVGTKEYGGLQSCKTTAQFGSGVAVVIDGSGNVLTSTTSAVSFAETQTTANYADGSHATGCLFAFTAEVPDVPQYRVKVGGKYEFVVPKSMATSPDLRLLLGTKFGGGGELEALPPVNGTLPADG